MKKITTLLIVLVSFYSVTIAQHGTLKQKSAYRTVADIEKKILSENSDTTAVRLIKVHKKAKIAMQSRLSKVSGYGKIKKTKPSIDKFKVKAAKKDSRFSAMNDKEKAADKAKKEYISSINPNYKKALPDAFPKK